MQSFNKLAGVQDASQHTDPAYTAVAEPPPVPQPDADIESQTTHSVTSRPSRALLPVDLQPSGPSLREQSPHPSLRQTGLAEPQAQYTASRNSRGSTTAGSEEEDLPWGPQHPCFPHQNSHVPRNSPEYASTRIIRVQRDWLAAGDIYPAFQNLYPEILIGHISETDFRVIIDTLNKMLQEAFNPWATSNWVDAVLGVMTGFLWDNTGLTATKRKTAGIERWIGGWNKEAARHRHEVRLVSPRRTGYLTLDIEIPDPHIDAPGVVANETRTSGVVQV